MIFRLLGEFVRRAWLPLLAGWVALLLIGIFVAPPWTRVAQDQEFALLPADSPSLRAGAIYQKAFPQEPQDSNVVIVLAQKPGGNPSTTSALQFIDSTLEPALQQIATEEGGLASATVPSDEPLFSSEIEKPRPPRQRSIIYRIRTPNGPGSGPFLVSPDGRAFLVVIELTTDFLSSVNRPTITRIEDLVARLRQEGKIPENFDVALTGSALMGRDHTLAQLHSVRATEALTILLVVLLLILIYRAPLLALIPLATVFLAVRIAMSALAMMADAGLINLFEGIEIYITILAYGAGVDYCLFLTARYREQLEAGAAPAEAVSTAIGTVGGALAASAATVICGIGMMRFARFGKFREAGFAIPFTLLVVLTATLTFSPALLRCAGRRAFWPKQPKRASNGPGPSATEVARGWLEGLWDRVGHALLRRPGAIWLTAVALMLPFAAFAGFNHDHLSYDLIGNLPADSVSVQGTRVLQQHFAPGLIGPATVLIVDPTIDWNQPQGRSIIARITDDLRGQGENLHLADVRSLTSPMGITSLADINPLAGLNLPEETMHKVLQRGAVEHYLSDLGGRAKIGARLDLILNGDPFSHRSIEDLARIKRTISEALPENVRQSAGIYAIGTTAMVSDLAEVIRGDKNRVELLVLASVFLILLLLLRRLVVALYLLLSVLFSYYTTLGVAFAVFMALDPQGFSGIDWKVAIFLFTILVAVGADYNIFLMARIDEEQRVHGYRRGIIVALDRTGPVISSCGIIMAGTFASLIAGSLTEMKQLGFALAFGVLLDTFVVRPVLVPAFLILWQNDFAKPSLTVWWHRRLANESMNRHAALGRHP